MKISDAKYEANRRYNDKTYEQIKIQSRRENHVNDLIKIAAKKRGMSAAGYILNAIQIQLVNDGVKLSDVEISSEDKP